MKTLLAILFSIGLTFMISCGNEQVENPVTVQEVGAAPSKPGTLEYLPVPVYDLAERVEPIHNVLRSDDPPDLNVSAVRLEEGSRGNILISVSVVKKSTGTIYSDYPVRVKYHPSINVHRRPLTYSDWRGNDVFLTDELGQMTLIANSRTGNPEFLTLDVGGYEYKVQFGSTTDD